MFPSPPHLVPLSSGDMSEVVSVFWLEERGTGRGHRWGQNSQAPFSPGGLGL